jgi:hypothetical protein
MIIYRYTSIKVCLNLSHICDICAEKAVDK